MLDYDEIARAIYNAASEQTGERIWIKPLAQWERQRAASMIPAHEGYDPEIYVARPVDDETLAIFAHELGHVATTRRARDTGYNNLEIEYIATRWALGQIKKHGRVSDEMLRVGQEALGSYLNRRVVAESREAGTLQEITDFLTGERNAEWQN